MRGVVVLFLLLAVLATATLVPHRKHQQEGYERKVQPRSLYGYVTSWPNGTWPFECRRSDMKRCSSAEYTDKFRKVRPGGYFMEKHLGLREAGPPPLQLALLDGLWLEIPLSVIGRGGDFDFSSLSLASPRLLVNRFEGMAQELNAKNRFAVLARNASRDLVFPRTLVTPLSETELRREVGSGELFLAKPAFGGAGKGIELFVGPEEGLRFAGMENYVLQKYVSRPALISGHRFTLRLYALVTSVVPEPVVFLNWRHGIVKFAVEPFEKHNVSLLSGVVAQEAYRGPQGLKRAAVEGACGGRGECRGARWDLEGLRGHWGGERVEGVMERAGRGVAEAVRVAVAGGRVRGRESSFQVLGVDFEVDEEEGPVFIEANVTPALGFQTEWELIQKEKVLASIAARIGRTSGDHSDWKRVS